MIIFNVVNMLCLTNANTNIDCAVNMTVMMYTENFLWRVQRQLGRSQSIEPDAAADDAAAAA